MEDPSVATISQCPELRIRGAGLRDLPVLALMITLVQTLGPFCLGAVFRVHGLNQNVGFQS